MGKTPQGSLPWLSKCWQPQSPLPQTRRFYFCGRTHRPNSMVNDFFQLLSSQLVKVLQVEIKLAPQFLQQDSLLLHHLAGGQLSRTPRLKAKETGSTRAFCCRSLLCSIILHALADSMHSCCMWLNDLPAFYSCFFKYLPKWCIYSALWLLNGWSHVKLLPSHRILCTLHNHVPCRVTSCKVTYTGCVSVFL